MIVYSLPTMRGRRCFRLTKADSFGKLEIILVKGFSFVEPIFAAKSPYSLPLLTFDINHVKPEAK